MFANNFAEYMRKALIKNLVASQYKDKIKKLYDTLTGIQMHKIEGPEGWVHVIK